MYFLNFKVDILQVALANDSSTITSTLTELTTSLAVVTSRTMDGISEYPADLMDTVSLLEFSIE